MSNSLSMKRANRSLILNLLRREELSRAELSRKTGLTRAAVSIIVDGLILDGFVTEGEKRTESVGRRPIVLRLNDGAFNALGIDISREGCFLILEDINGNMLEEARVDFEDTAEQTVVKIAQRVKEFTHRIDGVGVIAPGPVDAENGIILNPPKLDMWHGYPIGERLSALLGKTVTVEKDTNALALNEKNLSNRDNFLFILADHGLGCGIIRNGMLVRGYQGLGGELGHISLDVRGEKCVCGNRGCAEKYTSVAKTVEKAQVADYSELLNGLDEPACREALEFQTEMLAMTLVTAVNLYEPETVIFGGSLKNALFFMKEPIEAVLSRCALTADRHAVRVEGSVMGENCRGSAASGLALEKFFTEGEGL